VQQELFEKTQKLPEGFVYRREFITPEEEASLLENIRTLPLERSKYKEFTAKRRTVSYGGQYDFSVNRLQSAPPIPRFLLPLRGKVAAWVGTEADAFVHGLVSEYEAGTTLGWHRDVPNFEIIVGVSLGGTARMRLRPYRPGAKLRRIDVIALELEPRSAYVIRDTARWAWQHSIAPTKELRYSITFRTARPKNHADLPREGEENVTQSPRVEGVG
jgi:alkylated DNA repair dioxygenase AlkB